MELNVEYEIYYKDCEEENGPYSLSAPYLSPDVMVDFICLRGKVSSGIINARK